MDGKGGIGSELVVLIWWGRGGYCEYIECEDEKEVWEMHFEQVVM